MTNTNSKNKNAFHTQEAADELEDMLDTNAPAGAFVAPELAELQQKNIDQLQGFNELLSTLSSTEDKQKSLWRQIYENANTDRMNAYIVWIDLYKEVQGKPSDHAIHGQNLSRYMERMAKANDQLIKLAELVGNAKKKDVSEISEESIYEQMENESPLKH